jgi:hypothetical protein
MTDLEIAQLRYSLLAWKPAKSAISHLRNALAVQNAGKYAVLITERTAALSVFRKINPGFNDRKR